MNLPTVSAVIPMHNSSATIARALQSVFDQTSRPLEIIAVDDASTDDTCELVEKIMVNSPIPLKLIRLFDNLGAGTTRNEGWRVASGDLVGFLDADDAWHPRKLEIQTAAMQAHPRTVMSCHQHRFSRDNDWRSLSTPDHRMIGLRAFLFKNQCSTPSVVVRRNIEQRFGAGSHSEDYLLWMRIVAAHGPCLKVEAPLVHCSNPAFGGGGLSGQLLAMESAELAGYRTLHREGSISRSLVLVASLWSFTKFLVRVVRSANPVRKKQR